MIKTQPFALERYFDRHEFSAKYLLSCSDCEPLTLKALLALADPESRELWNDLTLAYTETTGLPALREAIAQSYQGIEPDNIVVMAPEEGVFLFMQTLLQPGDHVVCTFPGYQSLYELARASGCEVSLWALEEENGWHLDLDSLAHMLRDNTKLVVVNFPHNPTGYQPSHDEMTAIVDLVRRNGAYLFSDEMYRFLSFDGEVALPAGCEMYEKAVSLSGLSKSFGLPGLRLGWLATRDRGLLQRVSGLKDYTTICNSAPSEVLGLMALRARDRIVAGHLDCIQRNLAVLDNFMQTHAHFFQWLRPQGGSICFPRMLIDQDTHTFCESLVEKTGIMLVPSALFDFGDDHVRIGYGRDNFPDVLNRLSEYLAVWR